MSCLTTPLAWVVYVAHAALIVVMFYYTLFAPSRKTWIALVLIASMFMNWWLDPNGNCILTVLEARLKCQEATPGFTQRFIRDTTGIEIDENRLHKAQVRVFSVLLAVAVIRYVHFQVQHMKF